ncbi:MAG: glycosyltransferase family 4 protein, partial [Pseudomonadota bacterium]
DLRPEAVLILDDLWLQCVFAGVFEALSPRPAMIAYCPVDGDATRPDLYHGLARYDHLVAFSGYGEDELRRIIESVGERRPAISIAPHGVDTNRFRPPERDVADRRAAQRALLGDTGFIVLNANKHDARKRLDITIDGFARFARDKPDDVKLYLHAGATFAGPDLRSLAQAAGVSDRLIVSDGWLDDHPSVSDNRLAAIYAAADVGVNTSGGEGWGLVSFEHGATGAPQLIPDHSACGPLWRDVETRLPPRRAGEHHALGMMRRFVDAADVAAMLQRLYADRDFRRAQGEAALDLATRPDFAWAAIAEGWKSLLFRLIDSRKVDATTATDCTEAIAP